MRLNVTIHKRNSAPTNTHTHTQIKNGAAKRTEKAIEMAGAETSACEELYGIRDRILSNDMELSCSFRRNNHRIIGYSVKM